MATHDYSRGAGAAMDAQGLGRASMLTRVIDFSVTADNLLDADKGKVFDIPAKSRITFAVVEVISVEGATAVGSLGTATDADAFLNHIDFNALGFYHSGSDADSGTAIPERTPGFRQEEEDKIGDILLSGEDVYIACSGSLLDGAKVRFTVVVEDWDFPDSLI